MTRAEEKDMHDKDKKRKIPEDDLDDKAVFQFTDNSHLERKRFLVKWLLVGCFIAYSRDHHALLSICLEIEAQLEISSFPTNSGPDI